MIILKLIILIGHQGSQVEPANKSIQGVKQIVQIVSQHDLHSCARTSQRNCRRFQLSSQTNRLQFDIARFDHLDLCCLVQPPCLFTSPPMLLDIVVVDATELRNICTLLHQRGYLTSTKTKGGKRLASCSGSSLAWAAARSLLRNGILGGTVPSNGSLLSVACARNHIA